MRRFALATFLFFLLLPLVFGATYTPDQTIDQTSFTYTKAATADGDDYIFSVTPEAYQTFTTTLNGEGSYYPVLWLWDPQEEEALIQLDGTPGEELSFTYTTGEYKGAPKTYYLIINTRSGSEGASYTFTYHVQTQDDAGTGGDATKRFKEGPLLTIGTYEGFLGDEDEIDYYSMALTQGENLTVTITPTGKGILHFTLIDGKMTTTIDKKALVEGQVLVAPYPSPRTQTVYLGIAGDVPYTLDLKSINGGQAATGTVSQETGTAETESPNEATGAVDMPAIPELYNEEELQEAMDEVIQTAETAAKRSRLTMILIVAIVVVVVVAVFLAIKNLELQADAKSEKKSTKKTAKK